MAIQKEKTLKSGVTGNYWRITSVTIDRQNLTVIGQIALFRDKAASDAGMRPMPLVKTFKFPLVMSEIAPPTNLIAYVYVKIQAAADVAVTKDILGKDLDIPTTVDPDLSGGTAVL
jgi:hypothetical protein